MRTMRGGMEFESGEMVEMSQPPERLATAKLRWRLRHRPEVPIGQIMESGQPLTKPTDPRYGGQSSPFDAKLEDVRECVEDDGGWEVSLVPQEPDAPTSISLPAPRTRQLDPWLDLIRLHGPWDDQDGGVGLVAQMEAAKLTRAETVLCVGVDEFPPYPHHTSLLRSFPDAAVMGLRLMSDLVGASAPVMVIGPDGSLRQDLRGRCVDQWVKLVTTEGVYPQADPTLAVWCAAKGKRKLAPGRNPMEQRVVVIGPWTAIRLGRWLSRDRLDMVRPLWIGWPERDALMHAAWVWPGQSAFTLHTRLAAETHGHEGVLVRGHPLTGQRLIPEEAGANPFASIEEAELITVCRPGPAVTPSACISCSWCAQACPTSLRPARMYRRAQAPGRDLTLAESLQWCVDCGLCTQVCPSSLPLAATFRTARRRLAKMIRQLEPS
ncbi:MAG: 4Fe-4S dicluster domain-containing protein [Phycisphaeraceae bacterium]|nr:4Fe-4S dicluster domain-containing protein [Phycisphaeraceae bacterium]